MMKSESHSDNELQVKEDIEKLKNKGITSPPTPASKEMRVGRCIFYPRNKQRRKAILKRYGFKSEEELQKYNKNYGKN